MAKLRIQLVTANGFPGAPLRVDKEFQTIKERLPIGTPIDLTLVASLPSVLNDIRNHQPNIVHFTAHGSPLGEITLFDQQQNKPVEIPRQAFYRLFKLDHEISLVFFNACYSRLQAQDITEFVDCVIAIDQTIADYAAINYSTQFYAALAAGSSVQQAHDEAMVLLDAARLPPQQCPELIPGRKSPDEVFFISGRGKGRRGPGRKKVVKTGSYNQLLNTYGVGAESFSVHKVCNADGSSIFSYSIRGLTVKKGELRGLHFGMESAAGLAGAPALDKDGENLAIRWKPDSTPSPQTIDEVIDQARHQMGTFEFEKPLTPKDSPYSFGWTVWIRNSDALTEWEYRNLYTGQQQVHVDGKELTPPREYFARLAWFPVRKLIMGLELPNILRANPSVSYFRLKGTVPSQAVIKDNVLWTMPPRASEWYTKKQVWEKVPTQRKSAAAALQRASQLRSKLTIKSPLPGSCYSLDWKLPNPPIGAAGQRIVREAEVVRNHLLEYGQKRRNNSLDSLGGKIARLFKDMHEEIYGKYRSKAPEEMFQTTLMIYDQAERKLKVVDGLENVGEMNRRGWDFWLPFGFGLAGACFRAGVIACYSRNLDQHIPEIPEHYVEVPDFPPHIYLLALPLAHPQFDPALVDNSKLERCRQLIGVLTIGSTYAASHLLEICQQPLPEDKGNELLELHNKCQDVCDEIAGLFLEKNS
jgi:hypothetical protein